MRYDRFVTKLFCRPLLLEAQTRIGYELALLNLIQANAWEAGPAERWDARKVDSSVATRRSEQIMEKVNSDTAVIHIDGAIDRHLSAIDRMCLDATDLNDVDRALARAEQDSSVRNVLLAINSPGGSVNGVPETADRVAELAAKKNCFAFIDGLGASAAYWIASSADQVYSTGSSIVGSIGVYMALLDQTRRLENLGVKIETIKDGKLKAAGAQWKTLTDDERSYFQAQVHQIGAMFRAAVTAKRPGVATETMQGQGFFGKAALDAGLVDAILPSLDAALAQFGKA